MDLYTFLKDNTFLTVIFGVGSIFITIYYQIKNKQLNKKKITWEELQDFTNSLRKKINTGYKPDIYFSPCRRGATIANLMFLADENIPLFVGIREDNRGKNTAFAFKHEGFVISKTEKYNHYIPKGLLDQKKFKLLIIDDFADTGDSLKTIVDFLVDNGFEKENIKTATVVCSETAHRARKAPDYFSTIMPSDFRFPWGEAI